MNSSKSLRIILGGVLLVLAAGLLHWGLSRSDETESEHGARAETSTVAEQEAPKTVVSRPRPGVRLHPGSRAASVRATNQPSPPPGKRLHVEWKGTWYAAEILASATGSNFIRYSGYGWEWDEWVTPERMRYSDLDSAPPQNPVPPPDTTPAQTVRMTPEPGDPVALHGNQWWRVEVLKTEGGKSLVRYVGYGAEWDEWVGSDRFKVYSEEDAWNSAATTTLTFELTVPEPTTLAEPEINRASFVQGSPAKGDLLVEWGKMWWPAEILKQEGSSYLIHYKDYGSNWDEWVTLERIGHYTGTE